MRIKDPDIIAAAERNRIIMETATLRQQQTLQQRRDTVSTWRTVALACVVAFLIRLAFEWWTA